MKKNSIRLYVLLGLLLHNFPLYSAPEKRMRSRLQKSAPALFLRWMKEKYGMARDDARFLWNFETGKFNGEPASKQDRKRAKKIWNKFNLTLASIGIIGTVTSALWFHKKIQNTKSALELLEAIQTDNPRGVHAVLDTGVQINEELYGYTPLDTAAWLGQLQVLNVLLERGANPNKKSQRARLHPLFKAIISPNSAGKLKYDIVESLLEHGATASSIDIHAAMVLSQRDRETALRIILLLIQYGAVPVESQLENPDTRALIEETTTTLTRTKGATRHDE